MTAAVLYGKEDVKIEKVPIPRVGEGEALIKVQVALTCGTDLKVYQRGYHARMIVPPVPLGGQGGCRPDPLVQAHLHVWVRLALTMLVADRLMGDAKPIDCNDDIKAALPLAMRFQMHLDIEALLVESHRGARGDPRLAEILSAPITKYQAAGLYTLEVFPLLGERVFDLEEICEVRGGVDPDVEIEGLRLVIEDLQGLRGIPVPRSAFE